MKICFPHILWILKNLPRLYLTFLISWTDYIGPSKFLSLAGHVFSQYTESGETCSTRKYIKYRTPWVIVVDVYSYG